MFLKKEFKIVLILFPCLSLAASLPRVGKIVMKRDEVPRINVASGRSTVIKFHCNVTSFSVGPTTDIEAYLNERNSRILEVSQGRPDSQPAGLKVFCNDEFFVFDIVPTTSEHQDYVEVSRSYGALKTVVTRPLKSPSKTQTDKSRVVNRSGQYKTKKILASSKGE